MCVCDDKVRINLIEFRWVGVFLRRTTMSFSKHGRLSAETGQELDAIDPKASSNNKTSEVLSASNICRRILRLV